MENSNLLAKIRAKQATSAIIGLGYVGLPLAVEQAKKGFTVLGIDQSQKRIEEVHRGQSYTPDVSSSDLEEVMKKRRLSVTQQFDGLSEVDIITICVPTPLDKNKKPDISYIEHVIEQSLPHLKKDQLMILESTTYPGTTEEIILPRVKERGFKIGENFFLAFSPERVDPGNPKYKLKDIPKVVGGVTPQCTMLAKSFYESFLGSPVFTVSSPRAAEMTKLLENVFRIVNVSLVNELAMLCERMGIDIWEVIQAAATKPFGFMPFQPGPGMGGHCIPIDAFYLSSKAKEYDFTTRFIELAGEINDHMPEYIVQRVGEILNEHSKPIRGANILQLGIAYKGDVGDIRESPALKIAGALMQRGAQLSYHDPQVPQVQIDGHSYTSRPLTAESIQESDLILITTNHSTVDYDLVVRHASLTYDTRNALKDLTNGKRIYRLGQGHTTGQHSEKKEVIER